MIKLLDNRTPNCAHYCFRKASELQPKLFTDPAVLAVKRALVYDWAELVPAFYVNVPDRQKLWGVELVQESMVEMALMLEWVS